MTEIVHLKSLIPNIALTRRGFVATSLASGFALAAGPVGAETIRTDSNGLIAGEIKIPVDDGRIPGYRAMPASGGPFPAILVVQEIFGVHEHIKDICRRLAKLGHIAVAPELYARQGDASKYGRGQIGKLVREVVVKASDNQVMTDLDDSVAWMKATGKADISKLAITGFCWGGRIVWLYAAHNPNLKAGIAWYGPLDWPRGPLHKMTPISLASKIKAPILGLYGAQDGGIPLARLRALEKALKASGNTKSRIHVYPDAGHAFHADYRPSYRERPAKDGWKRLNAWLMANGAR